MIGLAPRIHPRLVVGVHEIARRVREVRERPLDARLHVRVQRRDDGAVAGVAHVVAQRDHPARRAVGGVVVDAPRLHDVREPPVERRAGVAVLEPREAGQDRARRLELAGDEGRAGQRDEAVASPVLVEPGQAGVDPVSALPRDQLVGGQRDPAQRLGHLRVVGPQVVVAVEQALEARVPLPFPAARRAPPLPPGGRRRPAVTGPPR